MAAVLCKIEGEKAAAFIEHRRVAAVQVFRHAVVKHAPAESNDVPAQVDDGKHHAVPEQVEALARLFGNARERSGHNLFDTVSPADQMARKRVPPVGRIPETEALDRGRRQPALLKILHALLTLRRDEITVKKLRRAAVDFQKPVARSCSARVPLLFRHLHARHLREKFHRLNVFEVLDFTDERDYVPARLAAEAVEILPIRKYVKRRRFFAVERAQSNEASAAFAQIDIPRHDRFNIAMVFEFLQKRVGDCHADAHSFLMIPSVLFYSGRKSPPTGQ